MFHVNFFLHIHPSIVVKPFDTSGSRLHFRAVELRRQRSWNGATEVYRKVGFKRCVGTAKVVSLCHEGHL